MPAHTCHETLDGYDPRQILVDGCPECEERAKNVHRAISHLDAERFANAWFRAAILQTKGLSPVEAPSEAETELLLVLAAVQVQLERRGIALGELPTAKPVPSGWPEEH